MSCFHPITAWVEGITENGKKRLRFAPKRDRPSYLQETVQVPCGQCIGCRLDYSRQWADRCLLELQYHDSAYFLTLTYNDAHVPTSWSCDSETGEIASQTMTLYKRDFQLFMKRLRKAFPDDQIRFFACGEYGEKYFRPHYHAIVFGLHLDDLEEVAKSKTGFPVLSSDKLQSCWKDTADRFPFDKSYASDGESLGFIGIGDVTWETCAYCARYILKKQKGEGALMYQLGGILPEFTLMSRKPGIARQFYDDHKERIYEYDSFSISTPKGGRKLRPSRYYDVLYDIDNPDELEAIKQKRKAIAKAQEAARLANTSLCADELRCVSERAKLAKIKSLKRSYEDA